MTVNEIIESAVNFAVGIANDNSHGYDQINRNGPDYDCSSLVITAYKNAGVKLTCTYTGNMKSDMLKKGFVEVPIANRKRGDVLLAHNNASKHTAMCIDSNNIVHASINEKGTTTGGKTGDQTGREICTRSFYNKNWDCCLRYIGGATVEVNTMANCTVTLRELKRGASGSDVRTLQLLLNANGANISSDGEFGLKTDAAVRNFQSKSKLTVDGEVGKNTWKKLIG